jgi:hypothetical protein
MRNCSKLKECWNHAMIVCKFRRNQVSGMPDAMTRVAESLAQDVNNPLSWLPQWERQ